MEISRLDSVYARTDVIMISWFRKPRSGAHVINVYDDAGSIYVGSFGMNGEILYSFDLR